MSFYFQDFPDISYDLDKTGYNNKTVTDLTVRYRLRDIIKPKTAVFYTYDIEEGERPDSVAHKWYGDSRLEWIIMITNNIVDPIYDWPLHYFEFKNFIESKYGSIAIAQQQIHHYEQIIRSHSVRTDGSIIKEKTVWVDSTTYNSLVASNRRLVYSYEYEADLNESKRTIKILDPSYVPQFLNEARLIFEDS